MAHFRPDSRADAWNLEFVAGLAIGGFVAAVLLADPAPVAISDAARADLVALGITDFHGLVPAQLFAWSNALSPRGLPCSAAAAFLVGFGASTPAAARRATASWAWPTCSCRPSSRWPASSRAAWPPRT